MLFEEKDFVSLVKIARVEDSSVGELVRKAVKKTYLDGRERELALRKKTFEELKVWQEKIGISKTLKKPTNGTSYVHLGTAQ